MGTKRRIAAIGIAGALVAGVVLLIRSPPTLLTLAQSQTAVRTVIPTSPTDVSRNGKALAVADVSTASLHADPGDKAWINGILIATQFDGLLARARKDPAFAYALAFALHQCANADKYYVRMKQSIDDPLLPPIEKRLEQAERTYAKCSGLSEEQLHHRYDLITLAARAGVLEAQLGYGMIAEGALTDFSAMRRLGGFDTVLANNETFVVAAARTGNPSGLYRAYELYAFGQVAPKDLVRAYRYLAESQRIKPNAAKANSLARLTSQLTPAQLLEAQRNWPQR